MMADIRKMVVVDSNILVYFYLREQYTEEADALLERHPVWTAPQLWQSEFRNTLIGYVRRGRIPLQQALAILDEATGLLDHADARIESHEIMKLAHASGCTAYDCEYVALAQELGVPLVTMDRQVLRAFPDIAVPLVARVA
jgi:predicted nucleic acid-binding protein